MAGAFELEYDLNKQHQNQLRREADIINRLPKAPQPLLKLVGKTLVMLGQKLQGDTQRNAA